VWYRNAVPKPRMRRSCPSRLRNKLSPERRAPRAVDYTGITRIRAHGGEIRAWHGRESFRISTRVRSTIIPTCSCGGRNQRRQALWEQDLCEGPRSGCSAPAARIPTKPRTGSPDALPAIRKETRADSGAREAQIMIGPITTIPAARWIRSRSSISAFHQRIAPLEGRQPVLSMKAGFISERPQYPLHLRLERREAFGRG